MNKNILTFSVLCLSLLVAPSLMADVVSSGTISLNHNDNIPNAAGSANVFADTYAEGDFKLSQAFTPAVGKTILLAASTEGRSYRDTGGLNRLGLGGELTYIQRLGLGAYAPRFLLSAEAKYFSYNEDLRSGWTYRASLGFEKRFSSALRVETVFRFENRTADKDKAMPYHAGASLDVFSQQNRELNGAVEYTFENYSALTLRYRYRDGEADTSIHPGSGLFNFSKAIAFDPALKGNYVAYLLNSSSQTWALDWSYPLGNNMAAGLSYEQRVAKTDADKTYRSNILSAQLILRF